MKREATAYTILAGGVFVYVLVRALLVPVIHDEARTYQEFIATGAFLPFRSAWDAGNHLLVTAPAQLSRALFGPSLFALRIWSVTGFVLYAFYVRRIGTSIGSPLVRWCFWLTLLLMPFMLDFFSLFRGYGLAMGFVLMALHHLVQFVEKRKTRDLAVGLLAISLASFGSLSLLPIWCATWCGCVLLVFRRASPGRERNTQAAVLLFALLPLAFAAVWSSKLASTGAFYFGSDQGLFNGTVLSLTRVMLGTTLPAVGWMLVTLAATVLLVAAMVARRAFSDHRALVITICMLLLLVDLVGRVLLGAGFGVLYPTDRTAMHLVPLFLVAFAYAVDRAGRQRALTFASLVLLVLPARTVLTANFDRTIYWPEQAIPEAFYRIASERQRSIGRPIMIGAYHQMPFSWRFTSQARELDLNELDPDGFPQPTCDLLMIDTTFKDPPPGFRTIARAATGHNNLMERIFPLRTQAVFDTVFSVPTMETEFIELWKPSPSMFIGKAAFVEWSAVVDAERYFGGTIALEVADAKGEHLHYHQVELGLEHPRENIHMALRLPPVVPRDGRIVCYIYDPHHRPIALENVRIRVHLIEQ